VLAIAGASPPVDGRDRLIRRQSPPSPAEGPDDPLDATRKLPEPALHGCHPCGADPRRATDAAVPSAAEADPGAVTSPGVYAPAELPAAVPRDPPVPIGAPAAAAAAPESAGDASHSRHASVGDHVFKRRAA
jgi:hypothetical protein